MAVAELGKLKVDQLKNVISNLNDTFYNGAKTLKLAGNKQDLVSHS